MSNQTLSERQLLERIVWLLGLISDQLELAQIEADENFDDEWRNELLERVAEKRTRLEKGG